MQLPKVKNLYPIRSSEELIDKELMIDIQRDLNSLAWEFWHEYIQRCQFHGVSVETQWKRQRHYLTDMFYRGAGYIRTRPILVDGRIHNGKTKKGESYESI